MTDIDALLPCPFCRHNLVISGEIARCATLGCWVSSRNVLVPLDVPRQVAEWNTRSDATRIAELEADATRWREVATDLAQIVQGLEATIRHVNPSSVALASRAALARFKQESGQ